MTEFLRITFMLLLALNVAAVVARIPQGIAGMMEARRAGLLAAGFAVALGTAASLGAMHEPILDALDIEPETFRVGAGIVAALGGIRVFVSPRRVAPAPAGWVAAITPLAFPLVLTPELAALTISYAADDGIRRALAALAVAGVITLAIAVLLMGQRDAWHLSLVAGAARFSGAVLAVAGVGLVVDGVRAI